MIELGGIHGSHDDVNQTRDAFSPVDERLAHVYEQIKSADEQIAHAKAQLSRQHETPRSLPLRSRNRPWLRGVLALLLAGYIVAAAFVSQSSYGDALAQSAPQLVSALTLPPEKLMLFTQPSPSSVQLTTVETPTAVPVSAEPAKSLETMARDLDNMEREIEQFKVSQQQLASDNATAIEQIKVSQEQAARDIARNAELLKASQEQVAQLLARASQQNPRPKTSAPPAQVATGTRKPVPNPALSHANAQPQAPTHSQLEAR
jgi:hypothetical protein